MTKSDARRSLLLMAAALFFFAFDRAVFAVMGDELISAIVALIACLLLISFLRRGAPAA